MSKALFLTTVILAMVRDFIGSVSNIDVFLGIVAGMSVTVAYHLIFEQRCSANTDKE